MERAVWKVMLPSTFCTIWWMWPLSTVTEPKRFSIASACAPSSVPQPHSAIDRPKRHMGEDDDRRAGCARPLRSSASQASCSAPRLPSPPAFRFTTLIRPMKCTPLWSKLYQPCALGALAVAFEIGLALVLVDEVVLAGHVVHVEAGARR